MVKGPATLLGTPFIFLLTSYFRDYIIYARILSWFSSTLGIWGAESIVYGTFFHTCCFLIATYPSLL